MKGMVAICILVLLCAGLTWLTNSAMPEATATLEPVFSTALANQAGAATGTAEWKGWSNRNALEIQREKAGQATATAQRMQVVFAEFTQVAALQQAQDAAATRAAIQVAGTQAAQMETASVDAVIRERQWIAEGWTATADSAISTATAAAQATATRYQMAVDETQQAGAFLAAAQTATEQASELRAVETIRAAQAESAVLALERDRKMNDVRAGAPWLAMGIVFGLLCWAFARLVQVEVRKRKVQTADARGDKGLALIEAGGKEIFYDADKATGPALVVDKKSGAVSMPALGDPGQQAAVTARDQASDLVNRGMPGAPKKALPQNAAMYQTPRPANTEIEIIQPEQIREILDEVETKLLMSGGQG